MKLYSEVINLASAQDRRDHMRAELSRAGVPGEFFPAFDYREHEAEEVHQYCLDDGPWGKFFQPHLACTISHSLAWDRFLASDADIALIMEDDIHISPETGKWLNDLSWWPEDADIVKIERQDDARLLVLLENKCTTYLGRKITRLLTRHTGAGGYLINRRTAQLLIASKPFNMPVDHILFNVSVSKIARALTLYQVTPALVMQGNEPPNQSDYIRPPPPQSGAWKLRQELRRGLYELAIPLSSWAKLLTGRARLQDIPYIE